MEKQVTINEKVYNVKPLLAYDFDKMQAIEDSADRMKFLHVSSSDISDEDYMSLTLIDRNILTKSINRINGWSTEESKDVEENTVEKKN